MKFMVQFQLRPETKNKALEAFEQRGPNRNPDVTLRELWVGTSTVATVIANRIAPGLLDRYLGRTGVRSQQTDEPLGRDRPVNLYEPVAGDHGAHGTFNDRAVHASAQLWMSKHKRFVTGAALAVAATLGLRASRN